MALTAHLCAHTRVSEKAGRNVPALFLHICVEGCVGVFVRSCERIRVGTQVQSNSSVLILRVLTVSIESLMAAQRGA